MDGGQRRLPRAKRGRAVDTGALQMTVRELIYPKAPPVRTEKSGQRHIAGCGVGGAGVGMPSRVTRAR
jgi:hypothetical protein